MAPTNPTVLTLQKMPYDMLSLIVSKVGATSSVDYVNTILTCKKLNISFDNYFVAKDLDLQALVQRPREANNYKSLMESFLRRNNVDAHYVQGILEYFEGKNIFIDLHHLRVAARRGHKEGRFIYAVLLMSLGIADKGKKALTKLTNEHGLATVECIWGNVRSSLNGIDLQMKKVYHQSVAKMTPGPNCHPPELKTACSACFHHYFLNEFVNLMMGLQPTVEVL